MRHIIWAGASVLALMLPRAAAAQEMGATPVDTDRWQITTEAGDYIWDIRLIKLSGDTLIFRQADTLGGARVEQIHELRLIRKTVIRSGGGEGAMQTAALTGSDDEVFDLGTLDFAARLRAIQQVLLVHPPSP